MTRVLLIEKCAQFGIERHLERANMTCEVLDSSEEIELAELDYDVIVFDLALGGFEIIRRLRRAGHRMPIVVLTGIDDYKVRVQALDAGADDVMVMPFFGLGTGRPHPRSDPPYPRAHPKRGQRGPHDRVSRPARGRGRRPADPPALDHAIPPVGGALPK